MVTVARFEATCEVCLVSVAMTLEEADELVGPRGQFRCDGCLTEPRQRRPPTKPRTSTASESAGCTVSALWPDGTTHDFHEPGGTLGALRTIVSWKLPPGAVVLSISTPKTIARDLEGPRSDPYEVERELLGRIGRLDLLPPDAR